MDFSRWQWNRIIVIAAVLIFFYFSASIFLLMVLATLISLLLTWPVNWVEERLKPIISDEKGLRNLAVSTTFVLTILFVGGASFLIFKPLVNEFSGFILTLPKTIINLQKEFIQLASSNQNVYGSLPQEIRSFFDNNAQKIIAIVLAQVNLVVAKLMEAMPVLVQAVLLPFLVYYFLRDREKLVEDLLSFCPVEKRKEIQELLGEISFMLRRYVRGQLLVCTITGILVFIGTTLLGVKYPLVLGFLAFLLETIPYVGPVLSFIPAAILAASISLDLVIKVAVFYLFVSFVENYFIIPRVMGDVLKSHPLVILLGMLLAAKWFGLIGMMLAVPAMATFWVLLRFIWKWR